MKKIFLSENVPEAALNKLISLGYEPRLLGAYSALAKPVASHADMLLFPAGDSLIAYLEYRAEHKMCFDGMKMSDACSAAGKCYPHDIALNALEYAGKLYSLTEYTDPTVLGYASAAGLPLRRCAQGYARCSVLAFAGGCVTSDLSLAKALACDGARVLTVRSGFIRLAGYAYGFIGGAAVCDGGTVMTFGELSSHPDGRAIAEFIRSCGGKIISLYDGELEDFGGAVIM